MRVSPVDKWEGSSSMTGLPVLLGSGQWTAWATIFSNSSLDELRCDFAPFLAVGNLGSVPHTPQRRVRVRAYAVLFLTTRTRSLACTSPCLPSTAVGDGIRSRQPAPVAAVVWS
jgi:hypothetical protein